MRRGRGLVWMALSLMAIVAAAGCSSSSPDYGAGMRGGGPPGGGLGPPAMPSVYEVMTEIEVTPEQLPHVRKVLTDAEDEREALFASAAGGPDPGAMMRTRGELDAINQRTEEELAALLTDGQMEKYRAMMERVQQERELMRSRMGGRPGGGGRGRGF